MSGKRARAVGALKVVAGALVLAASAAPARAAGATGSIAKLGTVNYRQVVRDAKPRPSQPELRNSPAQRNGASSRSGASSRTAPDSRLPRH